ncbi:MAG: HAMP domain-containing histidine kinase [Planctomycetaceae bacterium]|nr:HAMP domain-containing histidine kinase [Planctomycetaceae bacterium]
MKWPLKYQVMVPMTAVMLGTIITLSVLHAYLAAQQTTRQISNRIEDVTRTLSQSTNYPLSRAVLKQMQGLSGADFVLVDQRRRVVAATRDDWTEDLLRDLSAAAGSRPLELTAPVRIAGEQFRRAAVSVVPRNPATGPWLLHVLYPQQAYVRERRQAVVPPLVIGGIALAIVAGLAMAIASRVTRPLGLLREQVAQIAQGDFQPMTLPARDDEVRQLAVAVNQMAVTLAQYEDRIRHTEQIRTLAQLGGGLAHQLRNAVTGARMALDLHRADCPQGQDDESLAVATRQMILMEQYLQRFLTLGATRQSSRQELDCAQLVAHLLPLVQPAARHAAVQLDVRLTTDPVPVQGDRDALEHLALNILLNAIEAAGAIQPGVEPHPAEVCVTVSTPRPAHVTLTVSDTGPGPPPEIASRLFTPFVTGKPDGAGLGLAVAKEVAENHGGRITWHRDDRRTVFVVELPLVSKGNERGETAGR